MLLGVVVAGALGLIVVPKLNHARPLTVLSGSMVPTFDPGDVVVVRDTDAERLQVGDVITFQPFPDDPRLTTHRVEEVRYGVDGVSYVTKGDNNGAVDLEPVTPAQVKGEVWYVVPYVGHLSVWMSGGVLGNLVDLVAVGLLLYGGGHLVVGLVEQRRRQEVVV
jgi:signal peptidase I